MSSLSTLILHQNNHHQQLEDNAKRPPKRTRPKNVTWPTCEKMIQVRLFVAEDAPASSGSVSQDLLEARKAKLMHSNHSAPPDFEGVATKRVKFDMAAITAMVAQLKWKCPEKFSYHPSWLVAAGDESSEVSAQQHRELRTLEAFYPRISVIPASSMEPLEAPSELETSFVPQIPLVSLEDDEEKAREDALLEGKEVAVKAQTAGARKIDSNHSSSVYALSRNVENSDPDIAIAAAVAFAVLRAQESGTSIDHDLLIKILSNPLLIEAFKASNVSAWNRCEDLPAFTSSERESDPLGKGTPSSSCMTQEGEGYDISELKALLLHGNSMLESSSLPNGGSFQWRAGISKKGKGILGNGKDAFGTSACMEQFSPSLLGLDIPKKPLLQSPVSGTVSNASGWVRPNQSSLAGILDPPPTIPKKSLQVREKPPGAKFKRQCLFFNTSKGCRNGIYCTFLHDPPHAELNAESINQQGTARLIKNLKGTIADTQISQESLQ